MCQKVELLLLHHFSLGEKAGRILDEQNNPPAAVSDAREAAAATSSLGRPAFTLDPSGLVGDTVLACFPPLPELEPAASSFCLLEAGLASLLLPSFFSSPSSADLFIGEEVATGMLAIFLKGFYHHISIITRIVTGRWEQSTTQSLRPHICL